MLPAYVRQHVRRCPTKKVTQGTFEFEARWRKAYPVLTITDRTTPVPVLRPGRHPALRRQGAARRGRRRDRHARPSTQGPKSRGKAVLVTPLGRGVRLRERAASRRGRRGDCSIVVNDRPAQVLEYVGTDDGGYSTVPVRVRDRPDRRPAAGQRGNGCSRLGVVGVPDSPFVYDLASPYPDRIPSDAVLPAAAEGPRHGRHALPRQHPVRGRRVPLGLPALPPVRVRVPAAQTDAGDAHRLRLGPARHAWAGSAVSGPQFELVSSAGARRTRPGQRVTERLVRAGGAAARRRRVLSSTRYDGFAQVQRPAVGRRRGGARRLSGAGRQPDHEGVRERHPGRDQRGLGVGLAVPAGGHADVHARPAGQPGPGGAGGSPRVPTRCGPWCPFPSARPAST